MNPVVTVATCMLLIVSWANPYPTPYAGEIQGGVIVDGELRLLTLRENKKELAWWSLNMGPSDKAVESGFVVVMANPSSVEIIGLPILVTCDQLYIPVIYKE